MCHACKDYRGHTYHICPRDRKYKCGGRPLARMVYLNEVGPIPPGHHVHHKNFDRLDDRVENLECITASEHYEKHASRRSDQSRKRYREVATLIRECIQCHKNFEIKDWASNSTKSKFCSRSCLEKWRGNKFQPEQRTCEVCKSPYTATKVFQKYCCKKCNMQAGQSGRSERYQSPGRQRRKVSEAPTGI